MVVLVIHEFDIRPGKTKCHAPITVYRYRPMAVQIALHIVCCNGTRHNTHCDTAAA